MALGMATTLRNARLDAINTAINAGAGAGTLKIYAGARPATGGTATTLLATLTFSDPAAPAAAAGVLTFSAITSDSSADATGTATWARIADSTGTFVTDCSVTTVAVGTGDIQMQGTVDIVAGATVAVSAGTLTEGNA